MGGAHYGDMGWDWRDMMTSVRAVVCQKRTAVRLSHCCLPLCSRSCGVRMRKVFALCVYRCVGMQALFLYLTSVSLQRKLREDVQTKKSRRS
jgi:hypothetical protein